MAKTMKELNELLRQEWVTKIKTALEDLGEEVYLVKSNELAIPVVDSESNEKAVIFTIKVPTQEYEPYYESQAYETERKEKAEKAEKAKKEREDKAARDKAAREKAKALRESAKAEKSKK